MANTHLAPPFAAEAGADRRWMGEILTLR